MRPPVGWGSLTSSDVQVSVVGASLDAAIESRHHLRPLW